MLIFIQISLSIWFWLIVYQSSLNKPLLIEVIALLPISKFHLAFNPIFYGTINILIGNKPVYLSSFSGKNVNIINSSLDCLEYFKSWNVLIIKPVYLSSSSDKNVNFINNLLDYLRNFKSCNVFKK